MSKQIRNITLVMLLSCLGTLTGAAQNSDVPVITTIEDFEAAIAPALQIQSDGAGLSK